MRNKAINALLELGIPANTKGFRYITDAMEAIAENKELQYQTYRLYEEVAKLHEGATATKVERAIRYAFGEVTAYKNVEVVEKWLTVSGRMSNGNLLAILYTRLNREVE